MLRIGILGAGQVGPALAVGLARHGHEVRVGNRSGDAGGTFAEVAVDPDFPGGTPTMFIAGDDPDAKTEVTTLLAETGWDTADLGGIECSRELEMLCMTWVRIGVQTGTWDHAFKLLRG